MRARKCRDRTEPRRRFLQSVEHRQWARQSLTHEIRTRPTDDARQCCCLPRPADRLVAVMPAPSRARSPPRLVARYGAEMTVPDWRERLVCSKCGSREIDMVVTGTKRRERA